MVRSEIWLRQDASAMLAIEAEIEGRELRSSMTKQVHDKIELMTELVKRHMSQVPARYFELKVPLVADVGTGANWQNAKERE